MLHKTIKPIFIHFQWIQSIIKKNPRNPLMVAGFCCSPVKSRSEGWGESVGNNRCGCYSSPNFESYVYLWRGLCLAEVALGWQGIRRFGAGIV